MVSKTVLWYILLLLKCYISAASFDLKANSAYHAYHSRRMSGSFLLWKCHACLKWQSLSQTVVASAFYSFLNLQSPLIWRFYLQSEKNSLKYLFRLLISECWIGDLEYIQNIEWRQYVFFLIFWLRKKKKNRKFTALMTFLIRVKTYRFYLQR